MGPVRQKGVTMRHGHEWQPKDAKIKGGVICSITRNGGGTTN